MILSGCFQITDWQETELSQLKDGRKRTNAKVTQSYSGDIQGHSQLQYQMSYGADGNACFVGFEVIEAEVQGQSCTLTLKHDGIFASGVASSHFTVIDCQPAAAFKGYVGQFKSGEAGQAEYKLEQAKS